MYSCFFLPWRKEILILTLISLLGTVINAAPAVEDRAKSDLEQLKIDGRLKELQQQLEDLQNALQDIHLSKGENDGIEPTFLPTYTEAVLLQESKRTDENSIPLVQRSPGGRWGPYKKRDGPPFPFYDRPVVPNGIKVEREETEGGAAAPPESPRKFQLRLEQTDLLHEELLEAIERHLMEDLTSAQKYGIDPREILEHLHQKNARRTGYKP